MATSDEQRLKALRRRAEAVAKAYHAEVSRGDQTLSPAKAIKTLHELRVHQIELEMQNEELRSTQLQLDAERDRYFQLYDLAPVGYLSVSEKGLILQANLSATQLLKGARIHLAKQLFSNFIAPSDQDIYYLLRRKVIDTRQTQTCELQMKPKGSQPFWARLTVNLEQDGDDDAALEFRIIISDISERKVADAEREAALKLLQNIARRVPGVVYQYLMRADGSSCFPFASEAIRDIYRVSPKEVREDASKVFTVLHPDDYDAVVAAIQTSARELKPWQQEYRVKFPDGTVRWLFGNALPEPAPGGSTLWHGFITDVTESRQLKDALKESELRYRTIADFTADWEYWSLPDGTLRYVSPSCEEVCGYTPQELYADPLLLRRMVHPDDLALFDDHVHQLSDQGVTEPIDYRIRTKHGEERWIAHVCRQVFDADGKSLGRRASNRDDTRNKELQEQIRQLAFIDPLTALPNRRLLLDRLEQALAANQRSEGFGALMFLDLDNFKPLNDQHGHGAGDLLLLEVARRLKACVRGVDTVSRIGGDEFVVLLGELAADQAQAAEQASKLAEKVRFSLAEPYLLPVSNNAEAIKHHCSASIGVVLIEPQHKSVEGLLKWADAAMYLAKEEGRNRVIFMIERRTEQRP
ncbi:MAG: diguanylate cyclase [Comamonadaceae bacterium]|nr:MAG: diguanylate cyclase [Comamonadaceae bacterium]